MLLTTAIDPVVGNAHPTLSFGPIPQSSTIILNRDKYAQTLTS